MMKQRFPILLVDDDPLLVDVLRKAGETCFSEAVFTQIASFEDAKTYIDDLEGRGPRLILLDIDLQDKVDGLDFLALLRAHPKGRLIPAVILSANKTQKLVERAYFYGASSFTTKPFSYADWKTYLTNLRAYWYETVTLMDVRHEK
ncbi:response regulator [Spirosoma terrae]|nr:response regulator [Spirosoma terrae]